MRTKRLSTPPGEQRTNWVNVFRFVLARPSRLPVLAYKVAKRLRGENDRGSPENDAWLREQSRTAADLAARYDAALWEEAGAFDVAFRAHAKRVLKDIPHDLGGGAITDSSTGWYAIYGRRSCSRRASLRAGARAPSFWLFERMALAGCTAPTCPIFASRIPSAL